MRKIIAIAALCIFSVTVIGQTPHSNQEQLLAKSKKQKKTGTILLASGLTICFLATRAGSEDTGYGIFLAGAGALAMGSLYLIGGHNLRKQAERLNAEALLQPLYLLPAECGLKTIPALSLKLKMQSHKSFSPHYNHQKYLP